MAMCLSWCIPLHNRKSLPLAEITLYAVLGALTFAAQVAMAFFPNIEPVSLMVMVFAVVFGWKALYPVYVFVVMEILFHGLGIWNLTYLYIWTILLAAAWLLRNMRSPLSWALLSGVFGLMFGALCAPVDIVMGGFAYAGAKWISGIPFDVTHCVGNFVVALILFVPLRNLLEKLYARMKRT